MSLADAARELDVSPATTLEQAAEQCGLEPALVERIWSAVGFSVPAVGELTEEDG